MATEKMRNATITNIGRPPPAGARRSFLLHLVLLMEDGSGQVNAVGLQAIEADRPGAAGAEAAQDLAARADAAALELEDVLHVDLIVLDADDLGDAGHLARAVA